MRFLHASLFLLMLFMLLFIAILSMYTSVDEKVDVDVLTMLRDMEPDAIKLRIISADVATLRVTPCGIDLIAGRAAFVDSYFSRPAWCDEIIYPGMNPARYGDLFGKYMASIIGVSGTAELITVDSVFLAEDGD